MKTSIWRLLIVLLFFGFAACKNDASKEKPSEELTEAANEKTDTELATLFEMMQGSFDSADQEKQDSTYFNISLRMVQIWPEQGNYLYVEQALYSMQDKPYRQRVYKLERTADDVLGSSVYEIPNDSLWIGKWKTPEAFNSLKPEDLKARQGCTVYLKSDGAGGFEGSTREMTCLSSLRGASYATSTVKVYKDRIESWDQGFDAEGNQVWGAEKGGYVFMKRESQVVFNTSYKSQ